MTEGAPARDLGPLAERFRGVVGAEHVITHEQQLATYESDGLLQYAVTPGMVVLPANAAETAGVVRACHDTGTPWVARGAGSGLSGGALPVEDGVLIALTRMRSIREIDLDNGRVLVEPGVTNIAVSQAVGPTHFYPPDPSSQIVCTIGGNVAENSGGAHCFKYGFTTNYVTGLELVLADGSQVTLGGPELDHPGLDLIGAFVGSEGTLGIATGIWLRVVPKPESVRTLVAFFGSTVQAGEVVSEIVSGGIVPGAIEMMDNLSIRAAEGSTNAGYPTDAGAALVVELDGSVVQLGGPELDHPGYDLVGAFVGSEGTLGIATKIWLRVIPKPEAWRTLVAFFGSTVQAGEVVSRIVSEGIVPGAIEMMDNLSIRAAEGATNAGYPQDAGAALVVELDGSEAECEARFEHVKDLCRDRKSVV